MGTITVTPNTVGAYVRVEVDCSDDAAAKGVLLQRYPAGYDPNSYVPPTVRGSMPLLAYNGSTPTEAYVELSHGWAVFYDYEAPIGTPILYGAKTNGTIAVPQSAQTTLPAQSGIGWLKDPQRPASNVKLQCGTDSSAFGACDTGSGVYFIGLAGRKFVPDMQALDVPGAARGTVASSVRKDFSSTLRVITRSLADRDAMEALLSPGSVLLLQLPAEYGERDQYVNVGEVAEERIAFDHRLPWRAFTLPYSVEDAPEGVAQGATGARWKDLGAYATWTALKATGKTWGSLAVAP